jgi:4-amino-4-deoxy-L-arabinose transferase-like glycosyltransferase
MRRREFITVFGKGAGVAALPGRVQSLVAGKEPIVQAGFIVALLAIAIGMRAVGLNGPVDFDSYDEGVYWASLRSMSAGYHLYGQIFSSQPPLFLPSIYPFYALSGSTLAAARAAVAVLSVLGLGGAYLMGRTLSGRLAGLTALAILLVNPNYLAASQVLLAEAPATAFQFLTLAAAFLWHDHPTGRRGMAFAVICGVTLSLAVSVKLIAATAVVPVGLLVLARIWHIRHETRACIRADLMPMTAGLAAAVVTALCILAPFVGSLNAVLQQAVTFHLEAEAMAPGSRNSDTLRHFFAANAALAMAAIVGALVAILSRDSRTIPLAAWLLATLAVLAIHVPLFPHHLLMLIPPLIALIVLGMNGLPNISIGGPGAWRHGAALLMGLLAVTVVLAGIRGDYNDYRDLNARSASTAIYPIARIAADLERATTTGQWIITDAQSVAALANRDTPPWLVDTSFVRILSGHLTNGELLQAGTDPRVHAVLFATGRLTAAPVAGFHDWVAGHFNLLRKYDDGIELWIR